MKKTWSERVRDLVLLLITLAVIYVPVALLNYDTNYRETVCQSSSTVKEITEVRYRSVWFTLEDGTEVEAGQPKDAIVPGQDYCTSWSRERNDVPLSWWMPSEEMFE